MEKEEKLSGVFFILGLLVAGALLFYFWEQSGRRTVYDQAAPATSPSAEQVKIDVSIPSAATENGKLVYSDNAILEAYTEGSSVVSMKAYYTIQNGKSREPVLIGDMVSLSSRQYVWAVPLPKNVSMSSVWAEAEDGKGNKFSSNKIQNVAFEEKIDISEWKTHQNKALGFEIKVPRDWVIKNNTLNSPKNESILKEIESGEMYGEGYMPDITLNYFKNISEEPENKGNNLNAATLEQFVQKNPMVSGAAFMVFAGHPAYEMTRGGFGAYYSIMVEKNGEIYEIFFGNKSAKKDLSRIETAILSTFKFTK